VNARLERRLLQIVIVLAAVVPVGGGFWGVCGRIVVADVAAASEVRYLSGLLLGIGLAFWTCVPRIERHGAAVRLLGGLVLVGGLARLLGARATGLSPPVLLPLVMELGVTPLVVLWRERVERRLQA
jgi:hypothetical protein